MDYSIVLEYKLCLHLITVTVEGWMSGEKQSMKVSPDYGVFHADVRLLLLSEQGGATVGQAYGPLPPQKRYCWESFASHRSL